MFFNLSTDIFIIKYNIFEDKYDQSKPIEFTAYAYLSNTDYNKFYLMTYERDAAGFTHMEDNNDDYVGPENLAIALSHNDANINIFSEGWPISCNKVDMKKFRINPEMYRVINKELSSDKDANKTLYRIYLYATTDSTDSANNIDYNFGMKKVKFNIKSMNL